MNLKRLLKAAKATRLKKAAKATTQKSKTNKIYRPQTPLNLLRGKRCR